MASGLTGQPHLDSESLLEGDRQALRKWRICDIIIMTEGGLLWLKSI